MSLSNPRWGAPRIHGELLKLGFEHDRRRPVHVAVTEHPTSEWVVHQLLEAFPWDSSPRYLLRDRDGSYAERLREAANWLGIREVLTLGKDAPISRPVQTADLGQIVEVPQVGGLHHRYDRIAA